MLAPEVAPKHERAGERLGQARLRGTEAREGRSSWTRSTIKTRIYAHEVDRLVFDLQDPFILLIVSISAPDTQQLYQ
jgi:hypothetical protein